MMLANWAFGAASVVMALGIGWGWLIGVWPLVAAHGVLWALTLVIWVEFRFMASEEWIAKVK